MHREMRAEGDNIVVAIIEMAIALTAKGTMAITSIAEVARFFCAHMGAPCIAALIASAAKCREISSKIKSWRSVIYLKW